MLFPPLITAPTTHFSNFTFFICEVPTNSFSISDINFGTPHFIEFWDVYMIKKLHKNTGGYVSQNKWVYIFSPVLSYKGRER